MSSGKPLSGFPALLSSLIVFATSLHLSVGLVTHVLWLLTGGGSVFRYYFGYEDPLFLVLCTIVESVLAYAAWKQFSAGQILKRAWLFITISALNHALGMVLTHIFCTDSYVNPLYAWRGSWYGPTEAILKPLGFFLGGPVHMATLACGLFLALRLYRKHGIRGKLKGIDWIILGIVVVYTLRVAYVLIRLQVETGTPIRFHPLDALTWANDPLLCVLLFQVIFLRRSVAQLGWGWVAKCWGAYVVAIFLTSLASMIEWGRNFGVLPLPESAITWYIWPLVYTAYALGPIYQFEASRAAQARLEELGANP